MTGLFRGHANTITAGDIVAWRSAAGMTWRGRVAAVRVGGQARIEVFKPREGTWTPDGTVIDVPLDVLRAFVAARVAFEPGTIEARETNDNTELFLYGDLGQGGITGESVAAALRGRNTSGRLDIFLSSPGGDPFTGIAIADNLSRWRGGSVVHIDGLAASAATLIGIGASATHISPDGVFMIHRAWTGTVGDAEDMRHTITVLETVDKVMAGMYARKTGMDVGELLEKMTAEWWMDAPTARKYGFVDAIASPVKRNPTGTAAMMDRPWFARSPRAGAITAKGPTPSAASSAPSQESSPQPPAAASASNASQGAPPPAAAGAPAAS